MRLLLLALLIIPAIEIGVFIWIGGMIGPWWVVAVIFLTGVVGVALAKHEGTETWRQAQKSMNAGIAPTEQIVDGICIFIGGVFLLTPGFVTDLVGFVLVIPFTRTPFKLSLQKFIRKLIDKGKGTIVYRKW